VAGSREIKLHALVVPYDSGFRGQRMGAGPERLLAAGLFDGLPPHVDVTVTTFEAAPSLPTLRGEIARALDIQQWLAARVTAARGAGAFPLVLSGNCMAAVGIIAGLQARSRRVPGVCWFDAHADFNTPDTSESGFLDGMALATLTGRCWTPLTKQVPGFRPIPDEQVVLFGVRNLDAAERTALEGSDIHWLKSLGDAPLASEKLRGLRERFGEVYLHIDLDVLDQSEGRVNPYASAGGLTRERLQQLVEEIGASFHVGAAALTAYDPSSDTEGRIPAIARDIVATILRGVVA
jgi:arginase